MDRPGAGRGQQPPNPNNYRPFQEALFLAMDRWLRDDTAPPPSLYPRLVDGTLVHWEADASGWRPLPGVAYPSVIQQPELLDYGPAFEQHRRIDRHPPRRTGKRYGVWVPAVEADGNERGVLWLPRVDVPVATFTGWNLRNQAIGAETELLSLAGSRIPIPLTPAERAETGDPRQAVRERYADFEDYRGRYMAAVNRLVADRYLLPEHFPGLEAIATEHRSLFQPMTIR